MFIKAKWNFNSIVLCKKEKVKESLSIAFYLYHLMIQYYIYLSFVKYIYALIG